MTDTKLVTIDEGYDRLYIRYPHKSVPEMHQRPECSQVKPARQERKNSQTLTSIFGAIKDCQRHIACALNSRPSSAILRFKTQLSYTMHERSIVSRVIQVARLRVIYYQFDARIFQQRGGGHVQQLLSDQRDCEYIRDYTCYISTPIRREDMNMSCHMPGAVADRRISKISSIHFELFMGDISTMPPTQPLSVVSRDSMEIGAHITDNYFHECDTTNVVESHTPGIRESIALDSQIKETRSSQVYLTQTYENYIQFGRVYEMLDNDAVIAN